MSDSVEVTEDMRHQFDEFLRATRTTKQTFVNFTDGKISKSWVDKFQPGRRVSAEHWRLFQEEMRRYERQLVTEIDPLSGRFHELDEDTKRDILQQLGLLDG